MPIYEYACDTCGVEMEVLQRLSDAPLTTHEGCGGALRKLMSSPRTRVKENDGLTGSTHSSILRFNENNKIAAEKKKNRAR
jgi:putative FmdB family regulatory protein